MPAVAAPRAVRIRTTEGWQDIAMGAPGPAGADGVPGGEVTPIGSILTHTSRKVPGDYLLCDGQQVTEAAYPQLAAFAADEVAAGNPLWAISGSAPNRTVTVPDLRDRFIYGSANGSLGAKGGAATHLLTAAESGLPGHTHPYNGIGAHAYNGPGSYHYYNFAGDGKDATVSANAPQNAVAAHNNLPPYVVLAFVVKARTALVVSDNVVVPMEAWRVVGAPGQPAFASGWNNYDTGTAAGSWEKVGFRKGPNGRVALRGMAVGTSGVIFTLPEGYRPPYGLIFPAANSTGSSAGEIRIRPDGTVSQAFGTLTWISLDAIEFDTGEVTSFPAAVIGPARVTALPSGPYDGQEVVYVAEAAAGVLWHLRYNAQSQSPYKWEFVGGSPIMARVDTDQAAPPADGQFRDMPTREFLVIPLSGDYNVEAQANAYSAGAVASVAMRITGSGSPPSNFTPGAPWQTQTFASQAGVANSLTLVHRIAGIWAGGQIWLQYMANAGTGPNARWRALRLTPVRVG